MPRMRPDFAQTPATPAHCRRQSDFRVICKSRIALEHAHVDEARPSSNLPGARTPLEGRTTADMGLVGVDLSFGIICNSAERNDRVAETE